MRKKVIKIRNMFEMVHSFPLFNNEKSTKKKEKKKPTNELLILIHFATITEQTNKLI